MLLKVNCFAADKGKSLNCRVFIEAEMSLLSVYAKFHIRRDQVNLLVYGPGRPYFKQKQKNDITKF